MIHHLGIIHHAAFTELWNLMHSGFSAEEITMIPLLIGGVLVAGVILLGKLNRSPRIWADEKEWQRYKKEHEKWVDIYCKHWNIFR
jgi:hypothetical protein